ncbi:MAG: hypothetical protein HS104_35315 [Polyangiaceae bacterium]|nr:hypothetical protein [Polyangiaceae bacterium]MCE7891409.1 hypothetical protein [Sorangiineae bacterium PRO1]MCL4751685.1 hypothetical protein [Myxococcales bacterium]
MTPKLLAALFGCSIAAVSCGGDDEATAACEAPSCPIDYAGLDLATPSVSFANDVFPLFRRSCGLSSVCHGSQSSSAAGLYLGPKKSDTTTVIDVALYQQVIDGIANVPSKTAPAMDLVEPADPSQSFLMLKMDGCHNAAGLACTAQPKAKSGEPCGDSMPQGSGVLCAEDRDVVRRWIAQGAKID